MRVGIFDSGIGGVNVLASLLTKYPHNEYIFYGDTKAGCKFIEYQNLQFAYSEHYGFGKNQNYLRVIEGFDLMSADTSAYIYGSLTAE